MADLKDFQKDAIDAYLDACPLTESGVVGLWARDEIIQLVKKVRAVAPWGDLLSGFDVMDLVIRRLSRVSQKIPKDYVGLLKDAPGGDALITEAKEDLVCFLESLPRSYFVYFPLTSVPSIGQSELQLTPDIAIVDTAFPGSIEAHLVKDEAAIGLVAAMLGRSSSVLAEDTRYVRIRAWGYATESLTTDVATSALAELKHFVFISLARNIFKDERLWGRPPQLLPVVISYITPSDNDRYGVSIPEELGRFLARLQPNLEGLRYFDMSKGAYLGAGEQRVPATPQELASAMKDHYGPSDAFLSIPRDNRDMVRVKAAIEWWIDGLTSENQTISFLQLCIGFEALLGEPTDSNGGRAGERGVTERLSDRYAYLLGRTQSEREAYRAEFKKVYDRRGQIVHQRQTHLRRSEDAEACIDARRMLFNAIAEELNNVMKAVKK
jgi:hypothetical protein